MVPFVQSVQQNHLILIAVNEETDEDEGYDSITNRNCSVADKTGMS